MQIGPSFVASGRTYPSLNYSQKLITAHETRHSAQAFAREWKGAGRSHLGMHKEEINICDSKGR